MSDHAAAQATINEAGTCILDAVRIDPGRRALEGDVERAYSRLQEACDALELDDTASAQSAIAEALELLRTAESRLIAEDVGALEEAIRLIAGIRLN